MTLDPTDPPNVKLLGAVQLSGQPLHRVAKFLNISPEDLREIYAGALVPSGDTRIRIRRFALSVGIDIPVLEWLEIRSQILKDLEAPLVAAPLPKRKPKKLPKEPKPSKA